MTGPILRKIFHFDMDAFYAPAAQRDDPTPRDRPVVIRPVFSRCKILGFMQD